MNAAAATAPAAAICPRFCVGRDPSRFDVTVRKEILWESQTATDAEVGEMERHLIRETGANNPAIGYNLTPLWTG